MNGSGLISSARQYAGKQHVDVKQKDVGKERLADPWLSSQRSTQQNTATHGTRRAEK